MSFEELEAFRVLFGNLSVGYVPDCRMLDWRNIFGMNNSKIKILNTHLLIYSIFFIFWEKLIQNFPCILIAKE